MSEKKYSKLLTVILIIIIVAVIGLLGFLGYRYYRQHAAEQEASNYVDIFEDNIATETPTDTEDSTNNELNQVDVDKTAGSIATTYKGFEVIGTIEIPKTNLKYPILKKLSSKSLDTAVVAIYPKDPVMNSVGNVVIAGHNYRNGQFFSDNKKLSNGDKIYITDLEGNKVTYVIYNMFETTPTDTASYNKDTDGKREITLSTCTDNSQARLIVEAREEE